MPATLGLTAYGCKLTDAARTGLVQWFCSCRDERSQRLTTRQKTAVPPGHAGSDAMRCAMTVRRDGQPHGRCTRSMLAGGRMRREKRKRRSGVCSGIEGHGHARPWGKRRYRRRARQQNCRSSRPRTTAGAAAAVQPPTSHSRRGAMTPADQPDRAPDAPCHDTHGLTGRTHAISRLLGTGPAGHTLPLTHTHNDLSCLHDADYY
jgi:hypothetical protein